MINQRDLGVFAERQQLLFTCEPVLQPPVLAALGYDLKKQPTAVEDLLALGSRLCCANDEVGERHRVCAGVVFSGHLQLPRELPPLSAGCQKTPEDHKRHFLEGEPSKTKGAHDRYKPSWTPFSWRRWESNLLCEAGFFLENVSPPYPQKKTTGVEGIQPQFGREKRHEDANR